MKMLENLVTKLPSEPRYLHRYANRMRGVRRSELGRLPGSCNIDNAYVRPLILINQTKFSALDLTQAIAILAHVDMASRPSTMQAWQKHFGSTEPHLVEVPVPKISHDGLLVKVKTAGVCHSDYLLLNTEPRPPGWPVDKWTLGHEGCGEVVEVGDSVHNFDIGDVIAILSVAGCQLPSCGECSRGLTQLCTTGKRYGIAWDGSYAPYIAIKAWAAVKLPAGVPAEIGAVATDACLTAYHAVVGTGKVQKGETVLIVGAGGLGFNALQIALAQGARVLVSDTRQEVLDEAAKFLPEPDVIPAGISVAEYVSQHKLVIDTVVDFVGMESTFATSQEVVRIGGKIVQVGLLGQELKLNNVLSVRKQTSILCSYGGTMDDLKACLSLIAEGKLRPQVEHGKFHEYADIIHNLHAGKVKSRIAIVFED